MNDEEMRWAEMGRRIDGLVNAAAQDQAYGKALYRQFDQHCRDDENRHVENVAALAGIEKARAARAEATQAALNAQAAQLKKMSDTFEAMLPMMRRMRAREVFWRTAWRCLSRSKRAVVVTGLSLGGFVAWLNDFWPKLGALLRKLGH